MKTKLWVGILFVLPLLVLSIESGCVRPFGPITPSLPAPAPSVPTATPTTTILPGWEITNPGSYAASLFMGSYTYQYVHIHSGSGMFLEGPVTINVVQYFTLDTGGTITAYGHNTATMGPSTNSYSGGGHGGIGGSDSLSNPGGPINDNSLNPIYDGSDGAGGSLGGGGNDGGFLRVNALTGSVTLNGTVDADGWAGTGYASTIPPGSYGTGGGSGGTLVIQANDIEGSGLLSAYGGTGNFASSDTAWGGGGGGGIILMSYHTTNNFTGTHTVAGGTATAPAQSGQPGTFNLTTY